MFPWTYLEAAPTDIVDGAITGFAWSNVEEFVQTQRYIGEGQNSTHVIMNHPDHLYSAAKECHELVMGGYSDWFLPSLDELILMHENFYT